jgi:hypothetical protein
MCGALQAQLTFCPVVYCLLCFNWVDVSAACNDTVARRDVLGMAPEQDH